MVLNTFLNSYEENRTTTIVVFVVVLLVSIVSTLLIYYFIRYKKKYFFDASGRKFIVSTGEYPNIINKVNEIIQFDNKEELSEQVIKNSVGFLQLRNEKNQNLLHLCAMYGAKECMMYIKNFNILNVNEKDEFGNIPLYYSITNNSEDNHKNKEMFLWLCKGANVETTCAHGKTIKEIMNKWQTDLHSKFGKSSLMERVTNPDINLV